MEPKPWTEFLKAFGRALDEFSQKVIRDAWSTHSMRTKFYADHLLPRVAEGLGFDCKKEEFLNIDHLFRNRDSERVPQVFIESENNPETSEWEIRKLCAVACPLRVLITVARWDTCERVWSYLGGSRRPALLNKWGSIVMTHHRVCPTPGMLALLVGEWCAQDYFKSQRNQPEFQKDRFRYYAHHFDTASGKWQDDGIYQRYLSGPDENVERSGDWLL